MKRIELTSRKNEDWYRKFITVQDIPTIIDEECEVYKPDGSLLLKVVKNVLPKELIASAWGFLKPLQIRNSMRGSAAGIRPFRVTKEDGTLSNTTKVPHKLAPVSFAIGFLDRNAKFPFCRACHLNLDDYDGVTSVWPLIQEISKQFKKAVPSNYKFQKSVVDKTNPAFVIPGTVFTTVTVNKNWRTACHKDAGDLPGSFGVMAIIREGKFKGGEICFPDFGIGARYDTGDIVFSDVHEFHGNLPIKGITKDYQRCTLVCYYRENMTECGSPEEELERAKTLQQGKIDGIQNSSAEL